MLYKGGIIHAVQFAFQEIEHYNPKKTELNHLIDTPKSSFLRRTLHLVCGLNIAAKSKEIELAVSVVLAKEQGQFVVGQVDAETRISNALLPTLVRWGR